MSAALKLKPNIKSRALDGHPWVGVEPEDYERVLTGRRKTAERDLPVAVAQRWPVGVSW